jgi:hypothetical protein
MYNNLTLLTVVKIKYIIKGYFSGISSKILKAKFIHYKPPMPKSTQIHSS